MASARAVSSRLGAGAAGDWAGTCAEGVAMRRM
jgi:hypothetical protein